MRQYSELVQRVLTEGERRTDRTGVGTLSIFGAQSRYDLRDGFPLLTTKRVNIDAVIWELLWFLSGSTNIHDLHKECRPCEGTGHVSEYSREDDMFVRAVCTRCNGTKIEPASRIWDPWARSHGDLGPIYGAMWRSWPDHKNPGHTIDQVRQVIDIIKTKPDSRRILVSAWNVAEIEQMALPPCHALFQFYVGFGPSGEMSTEAPREVLADDVQEGWTLIIEGVPYYVERVSNFLRNKELGLRQEPGKPFFRRWANRDEVIKAAPGQVKPRWLDCQLYQRSADLAIGVPFNIASYALLTHMIAQECGLSPRYFVHTFGDAHIYTNHVEGLKRQLERKERTLPRVTIAPKPFFEIGADDIELHNYNPHPFIKFEVAV